MPNKLIGKTKFSIASCSFMISFEEIIFKILLITSLRKKAKWICKVKQFVYFQENKYVKDKIILDLGFLLDNF